MKPLALLLLVVFLAGCSNASNENSDFPELTFNVNSDLLDSTAFQHIDLVFFPPSGYIVLADSVVSLLAKQISLLPVDVAWNYKPVAALLDPSNPAKSIIVSTLTLDSISYDSFDKFLTIYTKIYRVLTPDAESTSFSINGVRCWQARIIDRERKLLRYQLLIERSNDFFNPPYQIDIIFPLDSTKNWGRVLESMLGTVSVLNISKEKR